MLRTLPLAMISLTSLLSFAASASAVNSEFVGLGAAPSDAWTDAANWSPSLPSFPANSQTESFDVLISSPGCPMGGVVFDETLVPVSLNLLTLRADCGLNLIPGSELAVSVSVRLGGRLDVDGGIFTATSLPGMPSLFADDLGVSDRAQVTASNGATVAIAAEVYSSRGLTVGNGLPSVATTDWTLFQASDPGTLLDLSSIKLLDAGFSDVENDRNHHFVTARDGATLDLSSVATLLVPAGVDRDSLTIRATTGSMIDLGGVKATSGGRLIIEAVNAEISLGTLTQHVEFSVDASESGAAPARINVSGWIQVFGDSAFRPTTAPVYLSRGFVFDTQDPTQIALGDAAVTFEGGFSVLELGGRDYGTDCSLLPDSNFGIGQMRIAENAFFLGGTLIEFNDRLDSGRRGGPAGNSEALYLLGPGSGPLCSRTGGDGLEIASGGALLFTVGGPNIYVWDDSLGDFVDLRALVGNACISAYGGMICSGFVFSDADADGVPESFDVCDQVSDGAYDSIIQLDTDSDGYGNACDADYDQDFAVTAGDFGFFLGEFGGPAIQADHDGDGIVTVADFGVFLSQFGGPPGTSGLNCAGTSDCH